MPYGKVYCTTCGWEGNRYHNAKVCGRKGCQEKLVRPAEAPEPKICPTCRRPITGSMRLCAKCGKQITSHHKWHVVGSRIMHRNCEEPGSY